MVEGQKRRTTKGMINVCEFSRIGVDFTCAKNVVGVIKGSYIGS